MATNGYLPLIDNTSNPLTGSKVSLRAYNPPFISGSKGTFGGPSVTFTDATGSAYFFNIVPGLYKISYTNAGFASQSLGTYQNFDSTVNYFNVLDSSGSLVNLWSYAITSSTQYPFNTVITASLALLALQAISSSYSNTASYALNVTTPISTSYSNTSSISISSSYAASASFAPGSISSSYALTSSNSNTASYALFAGTAPASASYALSSSLAIFANTASVANNISFVPAIATSSSFASSSISASFAANSTSASYGISSSNALIANSSNTSISASYSLNSTSASYALSASNTLTAVSSSNALSSSFISDRTGDYISLNNGIITISASNLVQVSASLMASSITGSHQGTSSWASGSINSITSSYAVSSSYSLSSSYGLSSSYSLNSLTASYVNNPLSTSASYAATASVAINTINCISASYSLVSSNAVNATTANFANNATQANTASYIAAGNISGIVPTSSYAKSASAAQRALTASYMTDAAGDVVSVGSIGDVSLIGHWGDTINIVSGSITATDARGDFIEINNGRISIAAPIVDMSGESVLFQSSTVDVSGGKLIAPNITGSLLGTASNVLSSSNALSSSYAGTASLLLGSIVSASYALTSSYSLSSSFVTASNVRGTVTSASYAKAFNGNVADSQLSANVVTYNGTGTFTGNGIGFDTDVTFNDNSEGIWILTNPQGGLINVDFSIGSLDFIPSHGEAFNFNGTVLGNLFIGNLQGNADSTSFITGSNVKGAVASASYATTASFALNGGGGGTTLTTGSTYPITSSWAVTSSFAISSSKAVSASFATSASVSKTFTGNILDAQLSSNVALYNGNGTFTNNPTFHDGGSGLFVLSNNGDPNVQIAFSTGEVDFTGGGGTAFSFDGTVVGNLFVGNLQGNANTSTTASFAQTASVLLGSVVSSSYALSSSNARTGSFALTIPQNITVNTITASTGLFSGSSQQNIVSIVSNINNFSELNNQNLSSGPNASTDLVATNNSGSETTYYVDLGINSSGYTASFIGNANDSYLYNTGSNFFIGNVTANKDLYFFSGGSTNTSSMVLKSTGKVGIGTINPVNVLDVAGNISCSAITASAFFSTSQSLAPTSANNYTINLLNSYYSITSSTDLVFASSSNSTPVLSSVVYISPATGSRVLTFNSNWQFLGQTIPVVLYSGSVGLLSLTSFGVGESSIVAAWSAFSFSTSSVNAISSSYALTATTASYVSASSLPYRAGQQAIGNLSTSQIVTFSSVLPTLNYAVTVNADSAVAATTIAATGKTTAGFTASLNAGVAGGVTIDYVAWLNN